MSLPTQLTVLRIILTPVFLLLIFYNSFHYKLLAFVVYTIASLTDWYDGYFARKLGRISTWGKFLDPLADKILVSAAFIAFYILGYVQLWMIVVIIVRDFLITGLRSYALFKKKPVVTSGLARAKTFLQMTTVYVIFIIFLFDQLALLQETRFQIIDWLHRIYLIDKMMIVAVFLTIYTGIHYFFENRDHIISIVKAFYRVFVPSDL
ncbi:MAG: CDP-diacylglycerol--glycerol-3-phosphate 3-phosphatidyltransferase [candidate division KSB1 bacterium]|nr:CDP-diacylglycerol--glycerol-3-phosphate 3-phosphatidyltransferase [candidate division KSB1 bacterium]MDZ7319295.1 CDP-diacylglycerol--glycerol-3-phosphate 3-phosphatidyltransferase [candidate division KSB1 bacterium]MDZ7342603.1 CDP-diacylglycerol--glycerol-3-phosphate 3-phosphatidyltransferase [candidate division KSB1 bacterium]